MLEVEGSKACKHLQAREQGEGVVEEWVVCAAPSVNSICCGDPVISTQTTGILAEKFRLDESYNFSPWPTLTP